MAEPSKNNANANGTTGGASVPASAVPKATMRPQTRVNNGGDENNDVYLPTLKLESKEKTPNVGDSVSFRLDNGTIIKGTVHQIKGDVVVLSGSTTAKEGAK